MNTQPKAIALLLSLCLSGGVGAQSTLIDFNSMPTWSSTMFINTDANWTNPNSGSGHYLLSDLGSSGTSLRAKVIHVPAWTLIDVSALMSVTSNFSTYNIDFAYKIGAIPASDYYTNPSSWNLIQSFSNTGINGNGNNWIIYGTQVNTGPDTVITVIMEVASASGVQGAFDEITVQPVTTLPVTLTSFTAENRGAYTSLKWVTASEINNAGFDIEISTNDKDFIKEATIPGHGTTQQECTYIYEDSKILEGDAYYRLKQTDYNGKAVYSNIVKAKKATSLNDKVKIYPNPCNQDLNWNILNTSLDETNISITDLFGRELIKKRIEKGDFDGKIILNSLPHGLYIFKLADEKLVFSH